MRRADGMVLPQLDQAILSVPRLRFLYVGSGAISARARRVDRVFAGRIRRFADDGAPIGLRSASRSL
jgi:hypothetical protein